MDGREVLIEHYLAADYTIEVRHDREAEVFVSRVVEWPGCMSHGDTRAEAIEDLQDAMRIWVEDSLDRGVPIPEPRQERSHSGKFLVRLPSSLHQRLVESAEYEGVSLNAFVTAALAEHVGGSARQRLSGLLKSTSTESYVLSGGIVAWLSARLSGAPFAGTEASHLGLSAGHPLAQKGGEVLPFQGKDVVEA